MNPGWWADEWEAFKSTIAALLMMLFAMLGGDDDDGTH